MTRKFLFTIFCAIFLGAVIGNFLFEQYKLEDEQVIKEINSVYFITEGTYSSKDQAVNSTSDIEVKTIVKEDADYVVYLGITLDDNNLEKLEKIYKDMDIDVSVKKMSVGNDTFLATLQQLDLLVSKSESNEEILNIQEVVLSNYEETLG